MRLCNRSECGDGLPPKVQYRKSHPPSFMGTRPANCICRRVAPRGNLARHAAFLPDQTPPQPVGSQQVTLPHPLRRVVPDCVCTSVGTLRQHAFQTPHPPLRYPRRRPRKKPGLTTFSTGSRWLPLRQPLEAAQPPPRKSASVSARDKQSRSRP